MFHWICPECGQEIAPGVKECPVCEPQASAASSAPAASVLAVSKDAPPAAASVPRTRISEPLGPPPATCVTHAEAISPSAILLGAEAAARPETQGSEPGPEVRTRAAAPEPATFADRLADLAERLHGDPVPYTPPRVVARGSGAPKQSRRRPTVIDVTPAHPLLAPPPPMRLLAEPQPPSAARLIPAKHLFPPHPASPGRMLGADRPATYGFGGFLHLPDVSGSASAPALADFQNYREAAESQMRSADCAAKPATSFVAEKTSLPGPALPRELTSLQAAGLVPVRTVEAEAASAPSYGWVARMAVLAIFLTAGLAAAYRVMPTSQATAAPAKPAPQPLVEQQEPPRPANSLARLVEVTGFRFVDVNGKPQIHYLVVNHSSAPLAIMTVYVTLRTTHPKPGQPPLARLMFQSPRLAAFEAKEMASPIERVLGPLELPDWQDLRADVDVQ